ncbi:hypothetical protein BJF91_05450 [Allorhizobium taibaishanense]|uniref:Uncharacterized protein n=1 Tax=Allorhizobium taibaishanense TaxID=887144 RepID=A0A1Q8ZZQ7_9HYPH|nr:hypothetical protein BJF91_05450 [Allorhizobium taibaishanense]
MGSKRSLAFGAGGAGFFDHGGVLLGHLVHLVDGSVDFREADGLFLGGRGNRVHQAVDGHDMLFDILQHVAGFVHMVTPL